MTRRIETDSLGTIEIAAGRLWGPQTERARLLFKIGHETFPAILIRALGLQKQAAAEANLSLDQLPAAIAGPIIAASAEIAANRHDDQFPLPVWQTGSGTQTNMNANEVIANLVALAQGRMLGSRDPVHPNDHVNRSQSSNDSFPTVMHIAAVLSVTEDLIPALATLRRALVGRAEAWTGIVKLGRTHMMDAVPILLSDEALTWAAQIEAGIARIEATLPRLRRLPQGGTAVGSGLNRPVDFDRVFCERLAAITDLDFIPNPVKSEGMAAHDAFVELMGALNTLAVSLLKIGNDIRLLGSGPRAGIGELIVPADGLSSSIMPGKTNPTQVEALTQVAVQVMGNAATVTIAAGHGHLQLNVFKPVIIHNVLQATTLLADAAESFAVNMLDRLEANHETIARHVGDSIMLVTALNPRIGYDRAVAIGKAALAHGTSLRDAAIASGHLTAGQFDAWVRPGEMVGPGSTLPGGGG